MKIYPEITNLTSDELLKYPTKAFEGTITVVNNADTFYPAIEYLQQSTLLGFDTETRPSFQKGGRNGISLLQLGDNERAYLFRVKSTRLPDPLIEIFQNPAIIKVGVAIKDDIRLLRGVRPFEASGFIDLQSMVKPYNITALSLRAMATVVLGFRISKAQQLSNWDAPILTEAQCRYAATDAWACYQIYKRLIELPCPTID